MSKLSRDKELAAEVGDRIKRIRKWRKLSQANFAAELGLGRSAVANYEQGRQLPDLIVVMKINQIYGVSTDWVLTGSTAGMTHGFIQDFFGETSLNLDRRA